MAHDSLLFDLLNHNGIKHVHNCPKTLAISCQEIVSKPL